MRRAVTGMILLGIALVLFSFVSMWLLGPGFSQLEERKPNVAPTGGTEPTVDRIHVKGRVFDAEWGVPVPASVCLTWNYGSVRFNSEEQPTQPDGTIDLYFEVPPAMFSVHVADWHTERLWEGEIDLGDVRIKAEPRPQLLKIISEGDDPPDWRKISIWTLEEGKAGKQTSCVAPPGLYLVRDGNTKPARYWEVDTTPGPVTLTLPAPPPPGTSSINVRIKKEFESPMLPAKVRLVSLEPYGFESGCGVARFENQGDHVFGELRNGTYEVRFECTKSNRELSDGGPPPLRLEVTERSSQEVEFSAYTFGNITLRMTRRGQPVENLPVTFFYESSSYWGDHAAFVTGQHGTAEVGPFPGQYSSRTYGYFQVPGNWVRVFDLKAVSGDQNIMEIELVPPGTSVLRVRGKEDTEQHSTVWVRSRNSYTYHHAEVDDSGNAVIEGLPVGCYQIGIYTHSFRTYREKTLDVLAPGDHLVELNSARGQIWGMSSIDDDLEQPDRYGRKVYHRLLEPYETWRGFKPLRDRFVLNELPVGRYLLALTAGKRIWAYSIVDLQPGNSHRVRWTRLDSQHRWPAHLSMPPVR